MTSRLSKKDMINDINIFFLKQGKVCEGNIYKVSKAKLLEIIIDNDIPHITNDNLKEEIEETEKFNYYIEIIYHNYMKYKNISIDIMKDIHLKNSEYKSKDLEAIITKYDLKYENDINELKELVYGMNDLIKNYNNSSKSFTVKKLTIPDIIEELTKIANNCQ
jgi:hypothetical protein